MSQTMLATHQLSASEEIRVLVKQHRGTDFIDIRLFYHAKDGNQYPTRKGLILSVENWRPIMAQLQLFFENQHKSVCAGSKASIY
jgi:hypothetical protein